MAGSGVDVVMSTSDPDEARMNAGANVKKTVLELGGSDAFVVLGDADLEWAAKAAAVSRLPNAGQSCVSAKRFIVERSVIDPFLELMTREFANQRLGDPSDAATSVSPMARADLREEIAAQVTDSIAAGAKSHIVHPSTPERGFFFPPTILTNVPVSSRVWTEETFGPVAPVLAAESAFGLGASLWTSSRSGAEAVGDGISTGMVLVNEMVQSNWRAPFGGVRNSGFGRELALEGLTEFANRKARHWTGDWI